MLESQTTLKNHALRFAINVFKPMHSEYVNGQIVICAGHTHFNCFVPAKIVTSTVFLSSRAEQLAIAQSTEERVMPKVLGGKLQRRGSLGGSLRRSKFKFTSQDKLDDQSFSEYHRFRPEQKGILSRMSPLSILSKCIRM